MDKMVDIKRSKIFLKQYIDLRNEYCDILLTFPVNLLGTIDWLQKKPVEVWGIVKNDTLLGAIVLSLHKDGEVSFFVKDPNCGIGNKLLKHIGRVAKECWLKSIWAWVLIENKIAQRVFEKNGFIKEKTSYKIFNKQVKWGYQYRKIL